MTSSSLPHAAYKSSNKRQQSNKNTETKEMGENIDWENTEVVHWTNKHVQSICLMFTDYRSVSLH